MTLENPYLISGPASISFSGGRTSAYLLRKILDTGPLAPDVHVLFANTGKESEATLAFVAECQRRWGVPIRWLEYAAPAVKGERRAPADKFREVTYETASRRGEPYEALITHRNYLPNPVTRFCTQELKLRPMEAFMRVAGHDHWENVVGLRADEPKRVARMRARNDGAKDRWEVLMPLARAGVSRADVRAYWAASPFDLALRSWEGNCDMCFMKARNSRLRFLQDHPGAGEWWAAQEERLATSAGTAATFQGTREPPMRETIAAARRLPLVPPHKADPEDGGVDCLCTD